MFVFNCSFVSGVLVVWCVPVLLAVLVLVRVGLSLCLCFVLFGSSCRLCRCLCSVF